MPDRDLQCTGDTSKIPSADKIDVSNSGEFQLFCFFLQGTVENDPRTLFFIFQES